MSALMREEPCWSDLALDKAQSGELDQAAQHRLSEHLLTCGRCSERRETMLRQRAAFLERAPGWREFVAHRERRLHGSIRQLRVQPRWAAFAALTALAALAVGLPLGTRVARSPAASELAGTRAKGGPTLGFYVKRGEQVRRGAAGDVMHPGELVRFTYSSDQALHFALLSTDRARAFVYHPLGNQTTRIAAGRDVPLDFSIRLDQQLGPERVYGLFCQAPLLLEPIRAGLEKTGKLPQLPGCQIAELTWTKQAD